MIGCARAKKSITIYGDHWHAFVFRWGIALRWRKPDGDWTHVSANTRYGQWRHDPRRHSRIYQIESWRTTGGTTERVAGSKRYVRLKVAL